VAFGALVQAFGPLLYRVIGRLVHDPDDRDDLVQETMVRAYQALGRFHPGSDFRPWLLTIAMNLVRDELRRRKRRPPGPSLDEGESPVTPAAPTPGPDAGAVGEELRRQAEAAFRRLDRDEQTILWLRVREGLQYDEIAQVLAIPRGTVMSRLARAREALRQELERDRGED
jgi:RNA polymerase sigma-70 factor (ECF subfamily)